MNYVSFVLAITSLAAAIFVLASPAKSQEYPVYSPTFPSGVVTDGTSTSTYTTGESVQSIGNVYFLGERKSCVKIGNGFICN